MEASNSSTGGGGEGGGGEARRVNVVYFLSRINGRVEHPHLLRIHRLPRDRVHLRDVKRWVSEFRGKDMSDSFAWSYKRRYRGGYIWQDLRDDDLITPFADNEYILKGSELLNSAISTPSKQMMMMPVSSVEIRRPKAVITRELEEVEAAAAAAGAAETLQILPRDVGLIVISPKPPPSESSKEKAIFKVDESSSSKQQGNELKLEKDRKDKKSSAASLLQSSGINDSNNCSKRVTQVLRNILDCKTTVQTHDDAFRPVSRQEYSDDRGAEDYALT